jgi:hypothetical protein
LKELVKDYKKTVKKVFGDFPDDPSTIVGWHQCGYFQAGMVSVLSNTAALKKYPMNGVLQ